MGFGSHPNKLTNVMICALTILRIVHRELNYFLTIFIIKFTIYNSSNLISI